MNNLERIISRLIEEVDAYIRDNEDIRKLRNSELEAEASASAVTTGEKASPTENKAEATVEASKDLEQTKESDAPGMFALFAYATASRFLPGHNETKAGKSTAAEKFIKSLRDLQTSLEKVYEPAQVKIKLDTLSELIEAEIKIIAAIRIEHGKKEGQYDAMLLVFKYVLDWLRQPENQELLCIALKTHEVKDTSKKGYYPQIPAAKELVAYLMDQILEIQLDRARIAHTALLSSYDRKVPEQAADSLMEFLPEAIQSLDTFNNLYNASKANQNSSTDVTIERLRNVKDVLGALCFRANLTRDTYEPALLGIRNPFNATFLYALAAHLAKASDDAIAKHRMKKADAVSATIIREAAIVATTPATQTKTPPPKAKMVHLSAASYAQVAGINAETNRPGLNP